MCWMLAAYFALIASYPANGAERVVQFTDKPAAPAFRAALSALRSNSESADVRLSEVSAAFVTLIDGQPPDLLVQLSGNFCGLLGCSFTLYEPGVQGWIRSNQWQIGSIGVLPEKGGAGWHNLILNHEVVWTHVGMQYEPARRTSP